MLALCLFRDWVKAESSTQLDPFTFVKCWILRIYWSLRSRAAKWSAWRLQEGTHSYRLVELRGDVSRLVIDSHYYLSLTHGIFNWLGDRFSWNVNTFRHFRALLSQPHHGLRNLTHIWALRSSLTRLLRNRLGIFIVNDLDVGSLFADLDLLRWFDFDYRRHSTIAILHKPWILFFDLINVKVGLIIFRWCAVPRLHSIWLAVFLSSYPVLTLMNTFSILTALPLKLRDTCEPLLAEHVKPDYLVHILRRRTPWYRLRRWYHFDRLLRTLDDLFNRCAFELTFQLCD